MIPNELRLKNFLSYGNEQVISFANHSLICLSGQNGHGKSALLDAITWALWGQARKLSGKSKPDEGLVRLGQSQMMVLFDFFVDGERYQVRREFYKTNGKPYSALDFSLYDKEADDYISLTDKTIKKTQEKIESVIGLDYETYSNSVYLRQGNANEFSKKGAKERKKILGTILGLNKYDKLHQHALDKGRQIQQKLDLSRQQQEADRVACEQITPTQEALARGEKKLNELAELNKTEETAAQKNREALQKSNEAHQAVELKERRIAALTDEIAQKRTDWFERATTWRKTHAEFSEAVRAAGSLSRSDARKHLEAARRDEQKMRQLQEQHLASREQLLTLSQEKEKRRTVLADELREKQRTGEQALTSAQGAHEQAVAREKQLTEQIAALEKQYAHDQTRVNQYYGSQKKREAEQAEYQKLQKQFEKRRAFYQLWVQRGNWLQTQQRETAEKADLISDDGSPSCPLCQQMITGKRKKFLHQHITSTIESLGRRADKLSVILARLKKLLLEQHEVIEQGSATQTEREQEKLRIAETERACERLAHEISSCQAEKKQVHTAIKVAELEQHSARKYLEKLEKESTQKIKNDTEMLRIEREEKQIAEKRAHEPYDQKNHQTLRERVTACEKLIADGEEREKQGAALAQDLRELGHEKRFIREREAVLAAERELRKGLNFDPERAAALEAEQKEIEKQLKEIRGEREKCMRAHGQLENQMAVLAEKAELVAQREKEIKAITREREDYQRLAQLWSKNGLPALLIEEAIPEIEHEANELLARLTNNQAHIFIESLRDLKKGGVKETLDIKISDTVGVRPYEMFSGGEAFRIDFALRIAISKLLARRAGAHLHVLIIDEGFGSQDEEGLSKLMDALHAVQSDFEKIIIVSHLDALKENFPTHFVVQKGPMGSHVTVQERG